MMQWLNMHGYASYVWSSYAVVFVALFVQVCMVKRYAKKIHKLIRLWVNE